MQKYIRTKDNIFEVVDILTDGRFKVYTIPNLKRFTRVYEAKDIIKQADTIKELCDMFVVIAKEFPMPVEMPLTQKEEFEKMKKVVLLGTAIKHDIQLKLAIWTDKGLIYVAKMNKEGEFELI